MNKEVNESIMSNVKKVEPNRNIDKENFPYNGWIISVFKSSILPSNCYCNNSNNINVNSCLELSEPSSGACFPKSNQRSSQKCQVCRYADEFPTRHLPEMVFPDNILRLVYKETDFKLEFNALDAIKLISDSIEPLQVACSEAWKASRKDEVIPNEVKINYDWTFTSDYKGTIKAKVDQVIELDPPEKINMEKLRERENILFYDELTLYEDELHDCGISKLELKIRVMPSGFFILLRFFLRVDKVKAQISDTRIYFENGKDYFLRETQMREQNLESINLESSILADPNLLSKHLSIVKETREKINFKLN